MKKQFNLIFFGLLLLVACGGGEATEGIEPEETFSPITVAPGDEFVPTTLFETTTTTENTTTTTSSTTTSTTQAPTTTIEEELEGSTLPPLDTVPVATFDLPTETVVPTTLPPATTTAAPTSLPPATTTAAPTTLPPATTTAAPTTVYVPPASITTTTRNLLPNSNQQPYSSCAEAAAAGDIPLLASNPRYNAALDTDNDAVACEN